jgi:TonB family protein
MLTLAGALLLATTVSTTPAKRNEIENPRFRSANGELCLVVRAYRGIGDFERVDRDTYDQNQSPQPAEPKPVRAALYRGWPSGYREPLAEFDLEPYEHLLPILLANDGHVAIIHEVGCDAEHELLIIRAPDGSIVRKVRTLDVITRHDQRWLCRGSWTDVRWSIDEEGLSSTLRATILVTDGKWDHPDARHETVDIDLATGAIPQPDHDRCPTALLVVAEPGGAAATRKHYVIIGDKAAFEAADVVPVGAEELLQRAVVKVMPEYPEVASKARITGRIHVEMVVARDGTIEAVRIDPLPFGMDLAVKEALLKWQFAPGERVSGAFTFRFEIVRQFPLTTTH